LSLNIRPHITGEFYEYRRVIAKLGQSSTKLPQYEGAKLTVNQLLCYSNLNNTTAPCYGYDKLLLRQLLHYSQYRHRKVSGQPVISHKLYLHSVTRSESDFSSSERLWHWAQSVSSWRGM